jgi:hypothetical protein
MKTHIRRAAILAVLVAICAAAALTAGVVAHRTASATAAGPCQLGGKDGQIKHVIYLQFDNTHYRRDNPNIASDLEQMPHLLSFLKGNGTLLTNDHTILISHTAGGIVSSLTGLYPDRNGQTVSNSYDYYPSNGVPAFTSSFKYWNNTVAGSSDPLPNMVSDGGQTTPAPWLTYTAAGCSVGGVSAANIELENATAVSVKGGPTPLAAAAVAGDTNIKVGSVSGFAAGQQITVGGESATISAVGTAGAGGTGITLTAPLASAHALGADVYGTVSNNPTGDVTSLFGPGTEAYAEAQASAVALPGTAERNKALTDLVGIAIHCAVGAASPCTGNSNARPDPATIYPGSDGGAVGLFGAKYVNPAIGADSNGCVKATDGANIADSFGQCGFPGFDGALAKNTLGEVEAMQLHGVQITYAYISDAHDNHVTATAMGPGEAAYQAQLKAYDQAFQTFFSDLSAKGIDRNNTLFVVTVDEGDHFAGAQVTPDSTGTATYTHAPCTVTAGTPTCPANQMGEVVTNLKGLLPGTEPPFDLHFDSAPTVYVNGQPNRTDTSARQLERDIGSTTAFDPYQGGAAVPIAQRLADTVEEQTLHMINADPKRTPTFTMFGNPDFFFQASNSGTCGGTSAECVDSTFAWNHGDVQDEIGNTWVGYVGPGVAIRGVDSSTWTDHTDIRPTINALLGLSDSYLDDGRVVTEIMTNNSTPRALNDSRTVQQLGQIYKQVNAPFGQFASDTLQASTTALKQPASAGGDLTYDKIETQIANLTSQRDTLAGEIRAALNAAADGTGSLDSDQAKAWIGQAQALLDQARALRVAYPAS